MTVVDDALVRHALLRRSVERMGQRANSNPLDAQFIELGVVKRGDTSQEARNELNAAFGELLSRIDHLTLIDVCGAFEAHFLKWISTAIGESRRVISTHYNIEVMKDLKERFIRDRNSFDSLDSIVKLVEGKVSADVLGKLEKLRNQRNRSAHGEALDKPPSVSVSEAGNLLSEILETFG